MSELKVKAYLASGFFNLSQLADLEAMKSSCLVTGVEYFSPKDEMLIGPDSSFEDRQKCFNMNVESIRGCDVVIVNTRDKDMGTIFEAGYAYALGKPIIYYFAQMKEFGGFNLMLSESGIDVVDSPAALEEVLLRVKSDLQNFGCIKYHRVYSGSVQ